MARNGSARQGKDICEIFSRLYVFSHSHLLFNSRVSAVYVEVNEARRYSGMRVCTRIPCGMHQAITHPIHMDGTE
jgi:hypothetical protein